MTMVERFWKAVGEDLSMFSIRWGEECDIGTFGYCARDTNFIPLRSLLNKGWLGKRLKTG